MIELNQTLLTTSECLKIATSAANDFNVRCVCYATDLDPYETDVNV